MPGHIFQQQGPAEFKFDLQLKLNTNENAYPPSPAVFEAMGSITADDLREALRKATVAGTATPVL